MDCYFLAKILLPFKVKSPKSQLRVLSYFEGVLGEVNSCYTDKVSYRR